MQLAGVAANRTRVQMASHWPFSQAVMVVEDAYIHEYPRLADPSLHTSLSTARENLRLLAFFQIAVYS